MNVADLFVLFIIALLIFLAIYKIRKNKKSGKCNCGCSSGSCGVCSRKQKNKE